MEALANYHDFSGFTELRARASANPDSVGKEVAAQFESIFIQIMLKSMRDTLPEGGVFESQQLEMYHDMFDKQLSLEMSNSGGIGLAAIIEQQLGLNAQTEERADAQGLEATESTGFSRRDDASGPFAASSIMGNGIDKALGVGAQVASLGVLKDVVLGAAPAAASNNRKGNIPETRETTRSESGDLVQPGTGQPGPKAYWRPSSPGEFVSQLRDYAQQAAGILGVSENLLIAQAALETGWGKKIMRRVDGSSSFNLFGIKAGQTWEGDTVNKMTLEYRDGLARKEPATFRAYESIGEAFGDYVRFLYSSPRYAEALSNTGNDEGYARGLQDAGYATDPAYADKILDIKRRLDQGENALALKNSDHPSLI